MSNLPSCPHCGAEPDMRFDPPLEQNCVQFMCISRWYKNFPFDRSLNCRSRTEAQLRDRLGKAVEGLTTISMHARLGERLYFLRTPEIARETLTQVKREHQPPAPKDERAEFEKWLGKFSPQPPTGLCAGEKFANKYLDPYVQCAWSAWQARAALEGREANSSTCG